MEGYFAEGVIKMPGLTSVIKTGTLRSAGVRHLFLRGLFYILTNWNGIETGMKRIRRCMRSIAAVVQDRSMLMIMLSDTVKINFQEERFI